MKRDETQTGLVSHRPPRLLMDWEKLRGVTAKLRIPELSSRHWYCWYGDCCKIPERRRARKVQQQIDMGKVERVEQVGDVEGAGAAEKAEIAVLVERVGTGGMADQAGSVEWAGQIDHAGLSSPGLVEKVEEEAVSEEKCWGLGFRSSSTQGLHTGCKNQGTVQDSRQEESRTVADAKTSWEGTHHAPGVQSHVEKTPNPVAPKQ
ncbi:hypothetical protein RU639_006423 [Aspergillus parasiticus]